MARDLSFRAPPALAVAENATTPTGLLGAEIWSTTAGKKLVWDGTKWSSAMGGVGGGSGDVVGPSSSIDGALPVFDGVTGKLLKQARYTGVLGTSRAYVESPDPDTQLVSAEYVNAGATKTAYTNTGVMGDGYEMSGYALSPNFSNCVFDINYGYTSPSSKIAVSSHQAIDPTWGNITYGQVTYQSSTESTTYLVSDKEIVVAQTILPENISDVSYYVKRFTFKPNGALGIGPTKSVGTAGQVLTSQGDGPPVWASASMSIPASDIAPVSPTEDSFWLDTTDYTLYVYQSGSWVGLQSSAQTSVAFSDVAPTEPSVGDLWIDSTDLVLYVCTTITPTPQWGAVFSQVETDAVVPVSSTAPTSPKPNQLWVNSTDSKLYVYYDDGTGFSWVEVSPSTGGGGGGSGDVVGPASSVSGDIALFDGTTGKLIKTARVTDASFTTRSSLDLVSNFLELTTGVTDTTPATNFSGTKTTASLGLATFEVSNTIDGTSTNLTAGANEATLEVNAAIAQDEHNAQFSGGSHSHNFNIKTFGGEYAAGVAVIATDDLRFTNSFYSIASNITLRRNGSIALPTTSGLAISEGKRGDVVLSRGDTTSPTWGSLGSVNGRRLSDGGDTDTSKVPHLDLSKVQKIIDTESEEGDQLFVDVKSRFSTTYTRYTLVKCLDHVPGFPGPVSENSSFFAKALSNWDTAFYTYHVNDRDELDLKSTFDGDLYESIKDVNRSPSNYIVAIKNTGRLVTSDINMTSWTDQELINLNGGNEVDRFRGFRYGGNYVSFVLHRDSSNNPRIKICDNLNGFGGTWVDVTPPTITGGFTEDIVFNQNTGDVKIILSFSGTDYSYISSNFSNLTVWSAVTAITFPGLEANVNLVSVSSKNLGSLGASFSFSDFPNPTVYRGYVSTNFGATWSLVETSTTHKVDVHVSLAWDSVSEEHVSRFFKVKSDSTDWPIIKSSIAASITGSTWSVESDFFMTVGQGTDSNYIHGVDWASYNEEIEEFVVYTSGGLFRYSPYGKRMAQVLNPAGMTSESSIYENQGKLYTETSVFSATWSCIRVSPSRGNFLDLAYVNKRITSLSFTQTGDILYSSTTGYGIISALSGNSLLIDSFIADTSRFSPLCESSNLEDLSGVLVQEGTVTRIYVITNNTCVTKIDTTISSAATLSRFSLSIVDGCFIVSYTNSATDRLEGKVFKRNTSSLLQFSSSWVSSDLVVPVIPFNSEVYFYYSGFYKEGKTTYLFITTLDDVGFKTYGLYTDFSVTESTFSVTNWARLSFFFRRCGLPKFRALSGKIYIIMGNNLAVSYDGKTFIETALSAYAEMEELFLYKNNISFLSSGLTVYTSRDYILNSGTYKTLDNTPLLGEGNINLKGKVIALARGLAMP